MADVSSKRNPNASRTKAARKVLNEKQRKKGQRKEKANVEVPEGLENGDGEEQEDEDEDEEDGEHCDEEEGEGEDGNDDIYG